MTSKEYVRVLQAGCLDGVEKGWSFRQGCYGINEYNEKNIDVYQ